MCAKLLRFLNLLTKYFVNEIQNKYKTNTKKYKKRKKLFSANIYNFLLKINSLIVTKAQLNVKSFDEIYN